MKANFKPMVAAVVGTLLFGATQVAMADSTDDLLKKLHDKGVLNDEEYDSFNASRDTEKVKKISEIKASFHDGIVFESGDKSFQMQINGRVQLDGRKFGRADAQNLDQMDLRRAYLGVKGKIYNDYDFNVTGDWAQGQTASNAAGAASTSTNQLDVAYFGINWWDQAKFRFGQFDMPFGMEHLTSDLFIDFQERSLTDNLVPGKERGAMIHGAPIKGVYYSLAASTGRGKNVSNTDKQVEGVDVIGRLTANFAEIMGASDAVYHVGGDFSHGYLSQNQTTGSAAAGQFIASSGTTEAKGIKFFAPTNFSASTAITSEEVERTRLGLEGAVAYGPVKFQTEWMRHNYSGNANTGTSAAPVLTAFDKDIDAWYVAANWMVTGESFAPTYKDGVWGRMKPKNDFIQGAGMGAVELSLRYSQFNASDFAAGTGPGAVGAAFTASNGNSYNVATGAHAWTAGVQWLLNPNTRLMANYVDTTFEDGYVKYTNDAGSVTDATNKERALTVRAQFDF
jgi:phosphate-selective porin OprO/OprP